MTDRLVHTGPAETITRQVGSDIGEGVKKLNAILGRGGVSQLDFSSDFLASLESDKQKKDDFLRNIEILLRIVPPNQREIDVFWNMFLNPEEYGQKMYGGKKVSEIAKMSDDEKNSLMASLDDNQADKLDIDLIKYRRDAEKKIHKSIEGKTVALIEIEKTSTKLLSMLEGTLTEKGKSFIAEGLNQAKKPESREYQDLISRGAKPEDIQQGKFDKTLQSLYIVNNPEKLLSHVEAGKVEEFKGLISKLSVGIGRGELILGDLPLAKKSLDTRVTTNRDGVEASIQRAVASGEYRGAIWRGDEREIVLYNDRGERKIFSLGKNPPEEKIEKSGLSISRITDTVSPKQKEKATLLEENKRLSQFAEKDYQNVKLIGEFPADLQKKSPNIIKDHQNAQKDFSTAKTPEEKLEAIKKLRQRNHETEAFRRKSIDPSKSDPVSENKMEEMLFIELDSITRLEGTLTQLIQNKKKLANFTEKDPVNLFDSQARSTLNYLTYIGYDELGQGAFDKIVGALNRENQGKIGEINLSKNPKLDTAQEKELLRVLARITRRSPLMGAWKGVDPTDEMIAGRQMGSLNWRTSLQDVRTSQNFIDALQGSADRLRTYIYEDISKKDTVPDFSAINEQAPQTFQA